MSKRSLIYHTFDPTISPTKKTFCGLSVTGSGCALVIGVIYWELLECNVCWEAGRKWMKKHKGNQ